MGILTCYLRCDDWSPRIDGAKKFLNSVTEAPEGTGTTPCVFNVDVLGKSKLMLSFFVSGTLRHSDLNPPLWRAY